MAATSIAGMLCPRQSAGATLATRDQQVHTTTSSRGGFTGREPNPFSVYMFKRQGRQTGEAKPLGLGENCTIRTLGTMWATLPKAEEAAKGN